MKMALKKSFFLGFFLLAFLMGLKAQDKKPSMRDTLDNKPDVSIFLINMHGFIPVPSIITEPALGNFGLVLAPVFISPQKSKDNKDRFHFPDITAGVGAYTLNNTWLLGAFRMGSIPKWGIRYTAALGLGNVNLGFYRELPIIGEQEFDLSIQAKFGMLELSKNIYKNRIFLGFNYMFATTDFSNSGQAVLPPDVFDVSELSTQNGALGFLADIDYRNSIFTADKGIRFKTIYKINREFTGSDFDFDRLDAFTHVFLQPVPKWVSGFKAEFQGVSSGAPFYAYPFIIMRGIPIMRYQGQQSLLFETEQRLDLNLRWSIVGFAGSGRTFSDGKVAQDPSWHWAGGAGFRYLMARMFKLRVGVDIAKGPDQFAYYIVFGHYWNR